MGHIKILFCIVLIRNGDDLYQLHLVHFIISWTTHAAEDFTFGITLSQLK